MRRIDRRARGGPDDLIVKTVQEHAEALLRLARLNSSCADDALDAYQRGLEQFVRHAARLEPATAHSWLFTVVKREAWAVRDARKTLVGLEEPDLDLLENRTGASPEDQVLAFEDVALSAEALKGLKPQEIRALWLKASGQTYAEIAETTGWTYTKVNRNIAEGRKHFLARYARIESGAECERWASTLSAMVDGEASDADRSAIRPHLKHCGGCRATLRALHHHGRGLEAVLPVGVLAAAGEHGSRDAVGWLTRFYEAAAGGFQERAAGSAAKVHALVEGASAGKVAAVAASAAAVAGGGVVAADHVRDRPGHASAPVSARAVTQRAVVPPALLTPISTIATRTSTGPITARTTLTRAERTAARTRAKRRAAARRRAARDRARRAALKSAPAVTRTPAAASSATGPAYDRSATAAADQEFTPAGVGATGPPRKAAKPAQPSPPDASTAAENEFSP